MTTTLLVTGGTGFIGQHLLSALPSYFPDKALEVRVLDYEPFERKDSLGFVSIQGDITNLESLKPAMEGVDWIFHLAGKTGTPKSPEDEGSFWRVNVDGTENLLRVAADSNVKGIVSLSSSSVYGDNPSSNCDETTPPTPLTIYGKTKLEAEKRIEAASATTDMRLITLRPSDVFGENSAFNVLLTLMRSIRSRRFFLIRSKHHAYVNYVYVGDLVDACIRAALYGLEGTFNVNTPELTQCFAVHVASAVDAPASFMTLPYLPAYAVAAGLEGLFSIINRSSFITCAKIKALTNTKRLVSTKLQTALPGWPRYGLAGGLNQLAQHYTAKGLL